MDKAAHNEPSHGATLLSQFSVEFKKDANPLDRVQFQIIWDTFLVDTMQVKQVMHTFCCSFSYTMCMQCVNGMAYNI